MRGGVTINFFEQELRKLAAACDGISNPVFAGRVCYGDLGGDNRVKLQFVELGTMDRYEALKATVLNRADGEVDSLRFHFEDIWGSKQVSNPNFRNGVIPYIWTYNQKSEWYVYKPTSADFKQLGKTVGAYMDVFTDRSATHQNERAHDSVVKKLREVNKTPSGPKKAPGHKKQGPEL